MPGLAGSPGRGLHKSPFVSPQGLTMAQKEIIFSVKDYAGWLVSMWLGGDPSPTAGLGGIWEAAEFPGADCCWRQGWGRHPQPAEGHRCPKLQMRKLRQTGPSPPPSWLCQASLGGGGALPTLGKGRYQREGARATQVAWGDEPLRRRRGTSLCARPPASPPPSSHPKLSPSFGPRCVQAWGLGGPPRAASCSGPGSQGRGCLGQGLGAAGGTCVSGVGMSLDPPDSRSPHPPPAGPSAGREPPVGGGGGMRTRPVRTGTRPPTTLPGVCVQAGKRRPPEGLCGLGVALSWGVWSAPTPALRGEGAGPGSGDRGS